MNYDEKEIFISPDRKSNNSKKLKVKQNSLEENKVEQIETEPLDNFSDGSDKASIADETPKQVEEDEHNESKFINSNENNENLEDDYYQEQ